MNALPLLQYPRPRVGVKFPVLFRKALEACKTLLVMMAMQAIAVAARIASRMTVDILRTAMPRS
jgi:TRAP-type C4-dicarboxylate transport system permease small subunit